MSDTREFPELLAPDRPLCAELCDQGLIRASGPDAVSFLQNLLTHDIAQLPDGIARLAGFCTPKGRLLALFRLWREADSGDILLILPRELLPAMLKKLGMYVLRSKLKLSDASDQYALYGIVGTADGTNAVPPAPTFGGVPSLRLNTTARPALSLLALPGGSLAPAEAETIALPVWHWLSIVAGLPSLTTATQEAFVPQMLNMELLAVNGVSFRKGCYPGQEIVARTQYLGKIKRRMYRARLAAGADAGAQVFAPETGDQPCGALVSVAPAPDGAIEALVCVQSGAVEAGVIHVGAPQGPTLTILPLPYELDGPDTRAA